MLRRETNWPEFRAEMQRRAARRRALHYGAACLMAILAGGAFGLAVALPSSWAALGLLALGAGATAAAYDAANGAD